MNLVWASALALQSITAVSGGTVTDTETAAASDRGDILGISDLSPVRRGEVRCAVLANLTMHEAARGVAGPNYGLTMPKAEVLAGRLAERLMDEYAVSGDAVRALYKADFEDYALIQSSNETAVVDHAAAMESCQPLFDSIALPADGMGDGDVTGLSEPETTAIDQTSLPPSALPGCFALLSGAALEVREREGNSPTASLLSRAANRIDARYMAEMGDAHQAAAAATLAVALVDGLNNTAVSEAEGEARFSTCLELAGPDE